MAKTKGNALTKNSAKKKAQTPAHAPLLTAFHNKRDEAWDEVEGNISDLDADALWAFVHALPDEHKRLTDDEIGTLRGFAEAFLIMQYGPADDHASDAMLDRRYDSSACFCPAKGRFPACPRHVFVPMRKTLDARLRRLRAAYERELDKLRAAYRKTHSDTSLVATVERQQRALARELLNA